MVKNNKRITIIMALFLLFGFASAAFAQDSGKIDINTASVEQLTNITGIGPAIAQRIVDYREKNGGFSTVEEIVNVRGIGEKTFEKIKNDITVAR